MNKTTRRTALGSAFLAIGAASAVALAPSASASCSGIPLPSGHYYGLNDGTPYSHSGLNSTDQANIKKVQNVLNRATGNGLAVDGRFGYNTRAATVEFQRYLNSRAGQTVVAVDGEYGKTTWYQAWNYGFGGYQC